MFGVAAAARKELALDDFLGEVLRGLRRRPRSIPPKYFYDAKGSALFDRICGTPEYYPTRTETGILERYGEEMMAIAGGACALIELGSGSATKTPLLLRHLAPDSVYLPIDICEPHLLQSTQRIAKLFPAIPMHPLCADYTCLPSMARGSHAGLRRIAFFPGSSIGNCTPEESVQLLARVASLVGEGGALLIGVDAKKPRDILEDAYNDAAGHTAAFNLNLLERMRRELGAQIEPGGFAHRAFYDAARGRIEMHLVSQRRQRIGLDGENFLFEAGESIHTENSYKYTVCEFQALARRAGWQPGQVWNDPDHWFNVYCLMRDTAALNARGAAGVSAFPSSQPR